MVGQARRPDFFVVLAGMFVSLEASAASCSFDTSDPLVFLGAGRGVMAVPRVLAAMAVRRSVTAITYEYGNTFLIVSGLLNVLVALDAFDKARGENAVTSHLAS